MKRTGILIILLLVLAAGVSAHDKGDLVLNIEPYVGIAFPSFQLFVDSYMYPGVDYSLRAIVDYYFTDIFALNLGLGYGGNYHYFLDIQGGPRPYHLAGLIVGCIIPPLIPITMADAMKIKTDELGDFFASYLTIPVGLRLSPGHFTIGAGATVNIPIYGSGEYEYKAKKNSMIYNDKDQTITFKLLPYVGWYGDIGIDSLGRKMNKVKFGVLLRLSGSFFYEIAEPSSKVFRNPNVEYDSRYKFNFISAGLIIRLNFDLANLRGAR